MIAPLGLRLVRSPASDRDLRTMLWDFDTSDILIRDDNNGWVASTTRSATLASAPQGHFMPARMPAAYDRRSLEFVIGSMPEAAASST
jgi:hypothetical protein